MSAILERIGCVCSKKKLLTENELSERIYKNIHTYIYTHTYAYIHTHINTSLYFIVMIVTHILHGMKRYKILNYKILVLFI